MKLQTTVKLRRSAFDTVRGLVEQAVALVPSCEHETSRTDCLSCTLSHVLPSLEGGVLEHRDADEELGAAFRMLHEEWTECADVEGVIPGSAADQCSDVYTVFTSHGFDIR